MTVTDTATPAPPRVRPPGRALLLLAVVLALAVPVISASGSDLPGRPVLGLLYVLAVPGVAVTGLLRLPSRLACCVLAIAVSLAALLLLSTAQLVAGLWSPLTTQLVLSAVAVACTTAELLRPPVGAVPDQLPDQLTDQLTDQAPA